MNAGDYLAAYTLMGVFYSLPKVAGFLEFLSKEPGWHEDIPGPAWVVSFVAGLVITAAALVLALTWPVWMITSFRNRGK
ncbi:MAG TPA: hypothetical protein VN019_10770 [Oxalicibacterium sp.]|nr:hypothetical protein [Oxalicibacterium sp.]